MFRSLRLLMGTEARDSGIRHFYWSLRSRDRKCLVTGRSPHAHWLPEPGSPTFSRHVVSAVRPPLPMVTGQSPLPWSLESDCCEGLPSRSLAAPRAMASTAGPRPFDGFLGRRARAPQPFSSLQEFLLGRQHQRCPVPGESFERPSPQPALFLLLYSW